VPTGSRFPTGLTAEGTATYTQQRAAS